MEIHAPKLTTYSARELEAFATRPNDRPEHLTSNVLDALLIGHPLTKLPVDCYKTPNDLKSRYHMEAIGQLISIYNHLWLRLLTTFSLLIAMCCFIYVVVSEFYGGNIYALYVQGKRLKTSCQAFFSVKPESIICYGALGLTCVALVLLSTLTKSWATCVTDYIANKTITLAAAHILRRVHYMYGILRSPDKSSVKVKQPIIYHACTFFEIFLRSRLFMAISNGSAALVCIICLVSDVQHELILRRWLITFAFFNFILYSCILSKNLQAVQWFKLINLLFMAVSLLLISKLALPSYVMTMLWQLPSNFFQSAREMEVFKRTITHAQYVNDGKANIENDTEWLFGHLHRMSFIFLLNFVMRIVSINKRLNLLQVMFRYNYLLEPVESVALIVAFCHLPPVAIILLHRSQLKHFTQSEIDCLILVGAIQSLFTSCSPAVREGRDFVTDSRFLCLLVPTATICAIAVGSIVSPPVSGEQSKLLHHSQKMCKNRPSSRSGLRKLVIKHTKMSCRVLLLLILAHQLNSRFVFVTKQIMRLVLPHTTQIALTWKSSLLNFLLIGTGSYLSNPKQMYDLIFSGVSNERLVRIDALTQETYPVLLSAPEMFATHANSCGLWRGISSQVADELVNKTLPLLSTTNEHSIFLILLRIAQNNIEEMLFYMAVVMVNVSVKWQENILATMFKLMPAFFIALAMVFIVVNFVGSIVFF